MTTASRWTSRLSVPTLDTAGPLAAADDTPAFPDPRGSTMQQRTLGTRTLSAIGLGGMPMSIEGRPDEARPVATKGGHLRPGDGTWTQNGDPAYLKQAAKESARRLGVDAIGLYQFHRPDPAVPYADSIGALVELLDDGVIQQAGISNADVAQI